MKKKFVWVACLVALAGCGDNSKETSIQGDIKGLGNDTIYLYGADGNYERIDTIIAKEGKFDHTVQIDTTTSAILLFNHTIQVPVFLNKKENIKIQGSTDALEFLTFEGGTANEEYSAFQQTLKGLGKPSEQVWQAKAEEFIRSHHTSPVSIYLLNTYFVQQANPDYTKIDTLIELMSGTLQDNPVIEQIKESLSKAKNVAVGRTAPYFSLPNAKKEMITRTGEFKDKYLLIHFWASWSEQSTEANAKLRKINRAYKKNKDFGMLGISFDVNRKAWKEAIKQDTLTWQQVCDFNGILSDIANQYAIQSIPTNVLIKPNGQIAAWNVSEEDIKRIVAKKDAS